MKSARVVISLFWIISLNILYGCFPDRVVTEPDYEVNEVRRPGVAFISPPSGAMGISRTTDIIIWFDELMDEQSVQDNFLLWSVVHIDSVRTIAIDPSNVNTIFLGKLSEGVFKTTDDGLSWRWMSESSFRTSVYDIVIDPQNSDIIYAVGDSGVLKSTDSGLHWEKKNNGLTEIALLSIAIDPRNSQTLYVTTSESGVFRTDDAAENWTAINNGVPTGRPVYDVVINPLDPDVLYLATRGNFVLKSYNRGESWLRLRSGLSTRDFSVLAVHPVDTSLVYAGSVSAGIFRSLNGGEEWEQINSGLDNLEIHSVYLTQDTGFVIIATGDGIYVSKDKGLSWNAVGVDFSEVGVDEVIVSPLDDNVFYAANVSGFYKSIDGGKSWETLSSLLLDSLTISGTFQFEEWQDSTTIIAQVDTTTYDTTVIFPYIYERALTGWEGGAEPPVETNPRATKMVFSPGEILIPNWKYQIRLNGVFQSDKITVKREYAARDIHGNSFETDKNYTFVTGNN